MIKKIWNILMGWYYKIFNKKNNLAKQRMLICKECHHKTLFLNQEICNLCGCVLDAKVRVENEQCYENKW